MTDRGYYEKQQEQLIGAEIGKIDRSGSIGGQYKPNAPKIESPSIRNLVDEMFQLARDNTQALDALKGNLLGFGPESALVKGEPTPMPDALLPYCAITLSNIQREMYKVREMIAKLSMEIK